MFQHCVSFYSLTTFFALHVIARLHSHLNQLSFLTAEHKFLLQLTLSRKVNRFPFLSRDVINQTLHGREYLNNSRPGRVCLVASRLGTGKRRAFFIVYHIKQNQQSFHNLFRSKTKSQPLTIIKNISKVFFQLLTIPYKTSTVSSYLLPSQEKSET